MPASHDTEIFVITWSILNCIVVTYRQRRHLRTLLTFGAFASKKNINEPRSALITTNVNIPSLGVVNPNCPVVEMTMLS